MHSSPRLRRVPRWDPEQPADDDEFLSASDLAKTLQPVPRRPTSQGRHHVPNREPRRAYPPAMDTPLGFSDWPFDAPPAEHGERAMDFRARSKQRPARAAFQEPSHLDFDPEMLPDDFDRPRAFQMTPDVQPRHSQAQLQRYQQQRQYQRAMQREFSELPLRRAPEFEHDAYARDARARDEAGPFDPPRRIPRSSASPGATSSPMASFALRPTGGMRDNYGRLPAGRRYNAPSPVTHNPSFTPRMDDLPLEPAMLDMYPGEAATQPTAAAARRRDFGPPPPRHRLQQYEVRRPPSGGPMDDELLNDRRSPHDVSMAHERRAEGRIVYQELAPPPAMNNAEGNPYGKRRPEITRDAMDAMPLSSPPVNRPRLEQVPARVANAKRPRPTELPVADTPSPRVEEATPTEKKSKSKSSKGKKPATPASNTGSGSTEDGENAPPEPKRRCGRKSMNYSSEQKRERNRAAVKKCRQRQALKLEYLQHKAEALASENQALSEMLVKNAELDEEQRTSLTRGIQMDILLKIKEIFTQSLPKDFVLDADSIWDLNSVLAVSMPSRCYYGIDSIKDFWRTSLRMRNKGKIRSFWAWLFRLPPGDRFSEFEIQPFSPKSNLYFISWTTKSTPPLAGSMVIMFGNGHRVTLHVECFGWLIWRYLLTNEPFPEPPME